MPERGTATIGFLCCYLVATSWVAARRRDGVAGSFEVGGASGRLGLRGLVSDHRPASALQQPDGELDRLPAPVHFPFAALAALAAALDFDFILRRELSGVQRIAPAFVADEHRAC